VENPDKVVEKRQYGSFYFRLDDDSRYYERQTYSMLEYLGDLGGLADVMIFAGQIMCFFIVHRLFVGKLIKSVYHIQKYTNDWTDYNWGQGDEEGAGASKF